MSHPDVTILKSLLEAGDEFFSGNELANMLGISRVGIWSRLEKLREEGFQFEGVRHKGYKLVFEPEALHERLLKAHLEIADCSTPLHFFESLDSTNSEAERLLANGSTAPMIVVAGQQQQGRGRRGRQWHSPPTGNLYASFAFRPGLPYSRMQNITLWLGARICDYLHRTTGVEVGLKWPNDLLIGNKKTAGMLTEARIDCDHTRDLVFGLGLNICGETATWPPAVAAIATCLSAHTTKPLRPNSVAAGIICEVLEAYREFVSTDVTDHLLALWQRYDVLRGKVISTHYKGEFVTGIAEGIDSGGSLRLGLADGGLILLNSGEVTIGSGKECAEGPPR